MLEFYKQYTKCNLVALIIGLCINNPFLNTILLINSLAICISYHSSFIFVEGLYKTIHEPLPRYEWEIYNFIGHILPILICLFLKLDFRVAVFAGLISFSLHMLWAYIVYGTYVLDSSYIKLEKKIWLNLWIVAITIHICTSIFLLSLSKIYE